MRNYSKEIKEKRRKVGRGGSMRYQRIKSGERKRKKKKKKRRREEEMEEEEDELSDEGMEEEEENFSWIPSQTFTIEEEHGDGKGGEDIDNNHGGSGLISSPYKPSQSSNHQNQNQRSSSSSRRRGLVSSTIFKLRSTLQSSLLTIEKGVVPRNSREVVFEKLIDILIFDIWLVDI